MTGPITKMLRKSASPASTWVGGVEPRPRAFRVRPSTTKILVKLVIISSRAGATDSAVIARMTVIELLGLPLVPGTVMLIVPLSVGAARGVDRLLGRPLRRVGLVGPVSATVWTVEATGADRRHGCGGGGRGRGAPRGPVLLRREPGPQRPAGSPTNRQIAHRIHGAAPGFWRQGGPSELAFRGSWARGGVDDHLAAHDNLTRRVGLRVVRRVRARRWGPARSARTRTTT